MVAPKTPSTKGSPSKAATKMHRRSRSGCFTCRLRRKKCDEGKNQCKACKHLGLKCEYKRPMWWSNNEQRKQQKDTIKNIIKRTKLSEKTSNIGTSSAQTPPGLSHSLPTSATYSEATARTRAPSVESQHSPGYDFNQPLSHDYYDFHPHIVSPPYDMNPQYQPFPPTPYEVDIKTERQMYVNDVPTRRDSMVSTFSTYQPPSAHPTLPSFPEDEWINQDIYNTGDMFSAEEGLDFDFFDFSHGPAQASQQATRQALIQVDDCDRPLLDHFIDNVLRLVFPIMEVKQHGSARSEVILPALESNKCYLHCCLSISAMHLKSTRGLEDEQINSDILRHRYATITELCGALNVNKNYMQILEATLGMIFFHCSVGRPDDALLDISWHQHFEAAINLIRRLELPHAMVHDNNARLHPPFNMTLASWVDILGATMLGRSPQFADTYREKNQSGSTSGLCELMGCEDSMMYMISEVACLDALKSNNGVNELQLCQLIRSLGTSLDTTEIPQESLTWPYSSTGAIRPKQLSRNMTTVFRLAARIYLMSLVPNISKDDPAMESLVHRFTDSLQLIPYGPDGFDRSIVWPLLIAGSQSTADSTFRQALAGRIASLGEHAEFGSFGRMVRLLQEVWRQSDEAIRTGSGQNVHWRDVMQQKGWDFLLI
ncbi:MAG: hypothetical protein L6R39_006955 [Caloplaca ligustica]|nr:MAG: hypothetical protein L6R39_006955 [Caloplaca ligustica]